MKHFLVDENCDTIAEFTQFDKQAIKAAIVEHLTNNPTDTITHEKELSEADKKKYVGNDIMNFYTCNPKTGEPSLIVTKGNKEYYKSLSN